MATYSREELDNAALRDLISDAEGAEEQAENGPFYPERGIDREMCLRYAAKCRAMIDKYRSGGAHAAVLAPHA